MRAKIRIFHQARPKDLEAVTLSYKRIGIRADVQKFFEDIEEKISEAQLVISRAGATTLTDISVIGRPAIFIPLSSARDDHQCLNAKSFEDKGAAISLRENEVSPKILSSLIQKILRSPSKALRMAKNSYAMSASKASFKIISKIEEKIGK
jgi:UDP-N-acetylglucosamine--N-acetylmuramyl-(pentapeptide) pyrophosphoryl-undecaprenol N-acetylglucosamine transferase